MIPEEKEQIALAYMQHVWEDELMTNAATFKNSNFSGKRDYECTNLVACVAVSAPSADWIPCEDSILSNLDMLYVQAGVRYYGWL